jgi:hypothetical protein
MVMYPFGGHVTEEGICKAGVEAIGLDAGDRVPELPANRRQQPAGAGTQQRRTAYAVSRSVSERPLETHGVEPNAVNLKNPPMSSGV